jgi:phosphatidylglycerol:prolipoprotein diacylglycerol transferase
VQDAGAGLYGGLALSFAVSWPVLRLMGLEFWRCWDGAAIIMLVGMVVTRIGCLINGCCSGRETQGPFGLWLHDDRGEWKRRYPTQLFEAAWSAIILGVGLSWYAPSGRPGLLFLGSAAAYGISRFGLELLRADASRAALPTRINVAFSAVLSLVSLAAFRIETAVRVVGVTGKGSCVAGPRRLTSALVRLLERAVVASTRSGV